MLTMDILLLPLQAYMCQTFNSAGGEPTLIHELKNMQFQLGLNIFLNFKSRVEGVFEIIICCDLSVVENFQFYYLFR